MLDVASDDVQQMPASLYSDDFSIFWLTAQQSNSSYSFPSEKEYNEQKIPRNKYIVI